MDVCSTDTLENPEVSDTSNIDKCTQLESDKVYCTETISNSTEEEPVKDDDDDEEEISVDNEELPEKAD